ncbi:DNA-binding transcriptional repressor PuuR [Variibacter gotjawalensis]|uniref:DNA-binding transcriptional repressor PuuR n=1 Tax=Variibacter gotjawalensis TaxID=1333996 RepID=A0A0S3Q085_9BRAD|nr:XRE family transcriptional regulator [Variibacter gotjawalensis]NIK47453.1 transcriptional regulator with XRE-family HTH domain [Variibacter gotjawalensis]RZS49348.1 XRE family transcriptional regulator [Variibacter gotjawalensis]BAT61612.1 DNA-binding transcriptional repressor PuuR [Variibacter gotjawalensis]
MNTGRRSPTTADGGRRVTRSSTKKEDAAAHLGKRVRALRHQKELTLEQLAERSKVSRAMLSKVERSEKSPTLAIITRIANGLGLSLSGLLETAGDSATTAVMRAANRVPFVDRETGFERSVISPERNDNGVEILLHRIPPGQSSGLLPAYDVPTQKHIIVQRGELTARVGARSYSLKAGDALFFSINEAYHLANEGKAICEYYVVIVRRG